MGKDRDTGKTSDAEMKYNADGDAENVQTPEDKKTDTEQDFAEQLKNRIYRETPEDEEE